jgi:hypothetical protein
MSPINLGLRSFTRSTRQSKNVSGRDQQSNMFHIDGMRSNRPLLLHSTAKDDISSNTVTCGLHSTANHNTGHMHAHRRRCKALRLLPYRGLPT